MEMKDVVEIAMKALATPIAAAVVSALAFRLKTVRDWFVDHKDSESGKMIYVPPWRLPALSGGVAGASVAVAAALLGTPSPAPGPALPKGAIIAIESGNCDTALGWKPFTRSEGKFLVGATTERFAPQSPVINTADLRVGSIGGTRVVTVQYPIPIGQVPTSGALGAMADTSVMYASEGGNLARYYVLPPYVAVTHCRLD